MHLGRFVTCTGLVLLSMSCGCADNHGWSFRIETRGPESRSCREVGLLEHHSERIPRALGTIVTPIGQFTPSKLPGYGAPLEKGGFWPSTVSAAGLVSLVTEPKRGAFLTPE